MEEFGKPNIVDFFPMLKTIDPQGIRRRISIHVGKLLKLFEGLIDERVEQRKLQTNTSSNVDVLDVLLNVSQEDPEAIERKDIQHMFLVCSMILLLFFFFFLSVQYIIYQMLLCLASFGFYII